MYFNGYREGFSWSFLFRIFSCWIDSREENHMSSSFLFSSISNESLVHEGIQVIGVCHVKYELLSILWNFFHLCILELHRHRSPDVWNSCTTRTFSYGFLLGLLGVNLDINNFLHLSVKFFSQYWMSWIPRYSVICIPFFLSVMS